MEKKTVKELKKKLAALLHREALKKGKFILSSGKVSNFYLDGRIITMDPEGAYLVASIILERLKGKDIQALGGPTLGADPIVGAVAALSYLRHSPIKTFIVRKQAKAHGTQRQIEGPALKKNDKVILVDDVATTGRSLVEAKATLDKMGVKIDRAIVIVDRNEGAKQNLKKAGCRLEAIFTLRDLGM
jgi:orotate phosphoribosyltransferase